MKISKYNSEGYRDPTTYEALMNVEKERRAAHIERLQQVSGYRPLIYICSPYAGDVKGNTQRARDYCHFAIRQKCIPVAPHLLFPQFLNDRDPEQRELGLFMGIVLLTKCVEVWVFGDIISQGMEKEIAKAESRGMPVRYFTMDCQEVQIHA
mgnify:FL=1